MFIFRNDGADCPQRLVCQANKDIFSRGHVLPSVMTYISNIIMSLTIEESKMSEILQAARNGRKGEINCIKKYPNCSIRL